MGKIANRQSLVFNEHGQLSQTIPQLHVEWMLRERTPIAQLESQRNGTQGLWGPIFVFWGQIWPPMNASDSNRGDNSR